MALNYKKLGNFIQECDKRNKDLYLGEDDLFGISVTKEFIISHANLVGVTFDGYKIVKPKEFAYIPDTSRRGDKIAISLNDKGKDIIVSSICTVFKIKNENELLPEYLMLWFMRPEFDRYARFMSNGSAREVFDWETMCDVELPVPSIEEQRKIVNDYKVITDRIKLLKKLNINLENQISAIFGETFEPLSFDMQGDYELNSILTFDNGYAFSSDDYIDNGLYKIITIGNVYDGYVDTTKVNYINEISDKIRNQFLLNVGDIVISLTGNVGRTALIKEENLLLNQRVARIVPNKDIYKPFVYALFRQNTTKEYLEGISKGTAQLNLSPVELSKAKVNYKLSDIEEFGSKTKEMLLMINDYSKEIALLEKLKIELLNTLSIKED